MNLSEILDYIIIESGQFLIGIDQIELDMNKFTKLVRVVLGEFNNHRPVSYVFPLEFGSERKFTFTDEFAPSNDSENIIGIPRAVTSVAPVEVLGTAAFNALYSGNTTQGQTYISLSHRDLPGQRQVRSDLNEKFEFPWTYRRPTLWIPFGNKCEVRTIHNHIIKQDPADANNQGSQKIDTIDYNETEFLEMLRGRFMMALGSSRTAFSVSDFPIDNNGDIMYNEGRGVYEDNRNLLINSKSKFYEAYGD